MAAPFMVQITCSPSALFALGSDGVVYKLVKSRKHNTSGILATVTDYEEWQPVTEDATAEISFIADKNA